VQSIIHDFGLVNRFFEKFVSICKTPTCDQNRVGRLVYDANIGVLLFSKAHELLFVASGQAAKIPLPLGGHDEPGFRPVPDHHGEQRPKEPAPHGEPA